MTKKSLGYDVVASLNDIPIRLVPAAVDPLQSPAGLEPLLPLVSNRADSCWNPRLWLTLRGVGFSVRKAVLIRLI